MKKMMTTYRNIFLSVLLITNLLSCSPSVENWNKEIKEQKGKEGWLPVLDQFEGKRIAFINIFSTEKLGDGIFYVKLLWVNHESIAEGYHEETFLTIEDCVNKRSAIVDSYPSIKQKDLLSFEWRKIEGDQLQPILCESLMKLK